jgi:hypothetical protein
MRREYTGTEPSERKGHQIPRHRDTTILCNTAGILSRPGTTCDTNFNQHLPDNNCFRHNQVSAENQGPPRTGPAGANTVAWIHRYLDTPLPGCIRHDSRNCRQNNAALCCFHKHFAAFTRDRQAKLHLTACCRAISLLRFRGATR